MKIARFRRLFPLMMAPFLCTGCASADHALDGRTRVTLWSGWTGNEGKAFQKLVDRFNATHSHLFVENLGGVQDDTRTIRAIAAGVPPDFFFLWDPGNLGPLVFNGAVQPLDHFFPGSGLKESDFIRPAITMGRDGGKLYSLPFLVDCEAIFWNRAAFREAGLDPDRPPRTLDEMADMAVRLTTHDSSGHITRLGIDLPEFNLILAIFGGRLTDEGGRPTADDPRNIAALEWYLAFAKRLGGIEEIESFTSGFGQGQGPNHPFFVGKVAMMISGEWIPWWIERYAPHLSYGLAPTPYATANPVGPGTVLVGGNPIVIPSESHHPAEAWEFIRWCQTAAAQVAFAKELNNVPDVRAALSSPELAAGSPRKRNFARFMKFADGPNARVFPPMPVMNYYLSELTNARDFVLHGDKDPEQALRDVQRKVLGELKRLEQ